MSENTIGYVVLIWLLCILWRQATLFYFVSVLLPIHACFNSPFAQRMRRALRGYNNHARADEKRKAAKVAVIETIGMEPPLGKSRIALVGCSKVAGRMHISCRG